MTRNELLRKLNMLFPGFSEFVEEKGLTEISKTFCVFTSMGLYQQVVILKRKAKRIQETNKFRYELLYRIEELYLRLDIIASEIPNIDFYIIDGVDITDAMLERIYNHLFAIKSNVDNVIQLLRKLSKSDEVELLCNEIEKAADELERVMKI